MKATQLALAASIVLITSCITKQADGIHNTSAKPNIIVFYVDDLGYGDVNCYGATGAETPNIDRLAENGIRFTDAHCTASTCTPSRYSLLTGEYAFRNNAGILNGDAPLIISTDKTTLPKMLQESGYHTGVVGKWHLGLGDGNIIWNDSIKPGPIEIGFDYNFLIPATGDRVPCVYVENHKVINLDAMDPITVNYKERIGDMPTGLSNPELLSVKADTQHSGTIVNHVSRIGFMDGGKKALWKDEDFPFLLVDKAKNFIESSQQKPFFLYYAFHDIHVPRIIHPKFDGKSTMGTRGDAIAQVDFCVGEIVAYLQEKGLLKNTIIVFSSDNGPVLNDGYQDQAVEKLGDHKPGGPFSGGKYSILEAGNRVPMIVSWKGITQTATSKALISHVDLFASFASLINYEIPDNTARDSENYLDVLLGKSNTGREYMLEEGFTFALRYKNWKYIKPKEEFAWIKSGKGIESGHSADVQLFNLVNDVSESNNIAKQHPDMVAQLEEKLNDILNKKQYINK